MVKRNSDGSVGLVIPSVAAVTRRQSAPTVYDMTTVAYVISPEFVLNHESIFEGRVGMVEVPRERAIDIDTIIDFKMAEFYLSN
jgi:N-acylneuraminate cytidylyltransferase